MTSRNEVRIDIEVEGGAKAERQFNRAEKGARGLGRSTRGLINPLLGAGLVSGILGGGLIGLALSSGAASNGLIRIQGSLEGLVGSATRSLEPAIDFAAGLFERMPIAAKLATLVTTAILGVLLFKGILASAGTISTAIATVAGTIATSVGTVVGLTIAATVLALGAIALIAWDKIFNDGRLLERFGEWLLGYGWISVINDWTNKYFDEPMIAGWNKVVDSFGSVFVQPYIDNWESVRDYFDADFTKFFTETIPGVFETGWDKVVGFFEDYFIVPFYVAWFRVKAFFKGNFVDFFTETIPGVFETGWDKVVGFFEDFHRAVLCCMVSGQGIL